MTAMKTTFPVQGMSCASCAASAESMLRNTEGVASALVNFATQTALVEYNPAVTSPSKLRLALQSVGFDLVVTTGDPIVTTEQLQTERLSHAKRQALGALALAIPVATISMFFMNVPYVNFLLLFLSTPVVLFYGWRFFESAWKKARHGQANMDTLVAISTGTSFLFSVFNTFAASFWHQQGLHAHVYYEAATIVIAFVSLGKWLEEKAKSSTSFALRKLIGLQSKTVRILRPDGEERELDIVRVQVGDVLVARPGEKIAVDGKITQGHTYVDESSITGEPVPASRSAGDPVFAGTINQQGSIRYRAEKVGSDTVLAQIILRVQEAQGSKAPVQQLVDKVASVFVPTVLLIAVATFCAWLWWGGDHSFSQGILAAVTVLVIACPCALGLATPTAIMVGIGKGVEHQLLIKDAESLEIAHRVDTVVLDKTGTLTHGKPKVSDAYWLGAPQETIGILHQMAQQSTHPLSLAIVEHLSQETTVPSFPLEGGIENLPGLGIRWRHGQMSFLIGNKALLQHHQVSVTPSLAALAHQWELEAKTLVYFANDKEVLAIYSITDLVKESASMAISQLREKGIAVHMLTGDHETTAQAVAQQVGIANYKANVLPPEKAAFVRQLQHEGHVVAMVGDGINDSEALAQADVSIAIGNGADIAMDIAKITLMTSQLTALPKVLSLSFQTVRTIRQNLFWAFVYNVIGIPIAAGALYPLFGYTLNPMIASAAMALSSVSVVLNSLRLKL